MVAESNEWARSLLAVAAGTARGTLQPTPNDLALAHRHGLIGLLADPQAPWRCPSATALYGRLAARQQVMRRHLRPLLERMTSEGIRVAVIKGPWLADKAYQNRLHRTFTDLDLVVHRRDLERSLKVLASYPEIGAVPQQRPHADKRELTVRDRSGVTFAVDLHWDLFSYSQLRGSADGAVEAAWEEASWVVESPLGPCWELPATVNLAFLCAHAVLDHRFRMILFRDLYELAALGIDGDDLVAFARKWRLCSTTYASLWIGRETIGAPVSSELLAELRPRGWPVAAMERLLPKVDVVNFDGHRPHPLNLAMVMLSDDALGRAALALRAPAALPGWWRRVSNLPALARSAMVVVVGTRRRGAEVFGQQLVEGLARRGWSSDFVALGRESGGPQVTADPLIEEPPARRLDLSVVKALRRRIHQTQPRVVLANGSATLKYTVAAMAGLRRRPALVYAAIGEPIYWAGAAPRRWLQRLLLARVDLIAAVSHETARQLLVSIGIPTGKVVVAETGVPNDLLDLPRTPGGNPSLNLLMVGSLTPEKDPITGLEAFARLSDGAARLRIVGGGPLAGEVRRRSEALGVSERVELVGPIEDIRPFLSWAGVLLLPSRTEGLPGAVLEAAAAGVPVVACDVGGVREAVIDGETGMLVGPGDAAALAAALERLAADPDELTRMGEAARRRVAARFLLDHALDRYGKVLELAIKRARS
jgi:glycosyltransferase involved in cell wall biosynthesis